VRFPGRRKHKHYFPVHARDPLFEHAGIEPQRARSHVIGIDQTLVDIDARVPDELLSRYGLPKGASTIIEADAAGRLYDELLSSGLISYEFAGGTVGNTLHNYSLLADDASILLGVMSENISLGTSGYRYLSNTSSRVNLDHLQPVDGPIGRCFALVTPDGERTFAISAGKMNDLRPESVPEAIFDEASCLVISAYLMRCKPSDPMPEATLKAIELAKARGIPVVLTLGTRFIIAERPEFWRSFLAQHVDIVAMNEEEAEALTGLPVTTPQEALAAAQALRAAGAGAAVITLGAQGALFHDGKRTVHVPAFSAGPVVETTGAGDAFNGGFAAALSRGLEPVDAVRFGSATAGISVTRPGTAPAMPSRAEIEALLAKG
jgi:inosine kinase